MIYQQKTIEKDKHVEMEKFNILDFAIVYM